MDITGIGSIADAVNTVVNKFWPDANIAEQSKADELKAELTTKMQSVLGQLEINKVEAASSSMFVAGARPFILWICGIALAYATLLEPLARFVAVVVFDYTGAFPVINTDLTENALWGLLGLGGYRTVEKINGVARQK
jgi:hypothetical protein